MASFADVLDTLELQLYDKGEDVAIAISGTYAMTILFQVEQGGPGSGAWQTIYTYSTANATVAATYTTKQYNEKVRLILDTDTSGTATVTLTDSSNRTIDEATIRDRVGNSLATFTQSGVEFPGSVQVGAPVSITAALTIDPAIHAGRTLVFNIAAGVTVTLPAALGTGDVYRFVVGTTVTSVNDVIQVANATDEFLGVLYGIDADTADALVAYPALDADGFDTITMNGSTKGGILGDYIEIIDIAAGKFSLQGTLRGTGTVATSLSAAVS